MNNSNQESTSFVYKKILSQLISFIEVTISATKENYIVSHLWNDLFTLVERSFHLRGTIVSPGWNDINKKILHLYPVSLLFMYF